MSQRDHLTQSLCRLQEQAGADQPWQELVTSRLPADLEAAARQMKAFERSRGIKTATLLLRALLCYVLSLTSLKELSIWSRVANVSLGTLSSQAWHRRLRQSGPWLLWIVGALLAVPRPKVNWSAPRVLLVDGTALCDRRKEGEVWRVHTSYDLLSGHIADLRVTDRHVAESFLHFRLQKGDVVIGDAIYGRTKDLFWVSQQQAFALVRFSPYHLPVYAPCAPETMDEARLPVRDWLHGLPVGIHERAASLRLEQQRLPVRLIAIVLPPEQAAALRRQRQRQARKKGRTLEEQTLFFAGFVLLLTTLPHAYWATSQVVQLYRCRWQVEMLFKRIKGLLSLHRLRCESAESAVAIIAALLIAWLLIEGEAEDLRRHLTDGEPLACPISSWRLQRLAWKGLCHAIEGQFSPQAIVQALPSLKRVISEHRARPLLEHQRRAQLSHHFEPDLVSFFSCSSA